MADDAGFAAFVRANSGSLFKTAYLLTGNARWPTWPLQPRNHAVWPSGW